MAQTLLPGVEWDMWLQGLTLSTLRIGEYLYQPAKNKAPTFTVYRWEVGAAAPQRQTARASGLGSTGPLWDSPPSLQRIVQDWDLWLRTRALVPCAVQTLPDPAAVYRLPTSLWAGLFVVTFAGGVLTWEPCLVEEARDASAVPNLWALWFQGEMERV